MINVVSVVVMWVVVVAAVAIVAVNLVLGHSPVKFSVALAILGCQDNHNDDDDEQQHLFDVKQRAQTSVGLPRTVTR